MGLSESIPAKISFKENYNSLIVSFDDSFLGPDKGFKYEKEETWNKDKEVVSEEAGIAKTNQKTQIE